MKSKLYTALFLIIVQFQLLEAQEIDNKTVIHSPIQKKWIPFLLSDVQLLKGSPFYNAMKLDEQYLKDMDVNRMLNGFLKHAQLPLKHGEYPGSHQPKNTRPGYLDHYLSAISLMYAQTGDVIYKERINDIINTLTDCKNALQQQGKGNTFLYSDFTLNKLHDLQNGKIVLEGSDETGYPWGGIGNIWYGIHKMLAGLRDAYIYTNNQKAFDLLIQEANFITNVAMNTNPDIFDDMLDIEHGGMNEVLADVYALTGNKKYLIASEKFNHQKVILNTALGKNVLYGRHVNMQVPTFVGTARQYTLTGNKTSEKATENFLNQMYNEENNVIGGSGRYERYLPENYTTSGLGFTSDETCATYNMLKVALETFEVTGDLQHMNYYEKALYNDILASQDPETGGFTYYMSLMPGGFKSFSDGFNLKGVWCCVGTGMENHAKYTRAIYFHNEKEILVNLFIPSTLQWKAKGLALEQKTTFPANDTVEIKILRNKNFDGTISFRCPDWVQKNDIKVWVNNTSKTVNIDKQGYLTLAKDWNEGDILKIIMPQHFTLEAAKDDSHLVSLLHGPIVYGVDLGTNNLPNHLVREALHYKNWVTPKYDIPMLHLNRDNLAVMLKATSKNNTSFETEGNLVSGKKVKVLFKPFYTLNNSRYTVYFKNYTESMIALYHKVVSDEINCTAIENEENHKLKTIKSDTVKFKDARHFWENNSYGRTIYKDGFVSYQLKNNKEKQEYVTVRFWGSSSQKTGVNIYIENKLIASENLTEQMPLAFYDKTYKIPENLTQGKKQITIKFEPKTEADSAAIYGVKLSTDPELFSGFKFY
ncbi:beta-L-arabinofuranosidase domain-containing protein [Zhouia sp. PK063]|uniref:glycoside hydrolase family 127 protein n=1 Tax=Zhouia sp. PK063 TaxID=3373602 RepID=UPI00378ACA22